MPVPLHVYVIIRIYCDTVDEWHSVHSVWIDETVAELRCIDLNESCTEFGVSYFVNQYPIETQLP